MVSGKLAWRDSGLWESSCQVGGWVWTPTKPPDLDSHVLLATCQLKGPSSKSRSVWGRVLFSSTRPTKAKLTPLRDSGPPASAVPLAWVQRPSWVSPGVGVGGGGGARVGFRPRVSRRSSSCAPGQSSWSGSGTASTWGSTSATAATRTPSPAFLPGSSGCGTSGSTTSATSPNACWTTYGMSPSSTCCTSATACTRRPRNWTEWGWAATFPGGGGPAAERALRQKVDVSPRLRESRESLSRVTYYPAAEAYASETSCLRSFQSPIPRSYLYA